MANTRPPGYQEVPNPTVTYQPQFQPMVNPAYPNVQQQQAPQTVVIQQPTSTVTTTIVTQQQMSGWNSGLCDCFQDCKSCLCSFICGNFYYAALSSRMGENCCVGCSGYGAGCVPGGHLAMRSRFRGSHNIQGSICDDCFMVSCCTPCAMAQLSREMDKLGYSPNC